MEIKDITESLQKAKEQKKKRNFSQTYDLIISLKGINFKKPEEQVNQFITLHYSRGKDIKVCALVGPELKEEAEKNCDKTIPVGDFDKFNDKKELKKIANDYDFFIAQANVMGKAAQTFGKVLGTRGKMPNPKAGCVVPPKTSLGPLMERLKKTVNAVAKTQLAVQVPVGNESMPDNEVADNIKTVYTAVEHALPAERNNIKAVRVKLTMGAPVEIKF